MLLGANALARISAPLTATPANRYDEDFQLGLTRCPPCC
jgi:hypothetical protein